MTWIYLWLVFLGLLVPNSLVSVSFNMLEAGWLMALILKPLKSWRSGAIVGSLALVNLVVIGQFWEINLAIWGSAALMVGYLLGRLVVGKSKAYFRLFLLLVFIGLLTIVKTDGKKMGDWLVSKPQPPYTTDMSAHLATWYQIKAGKNYYPAFGEVILIKQGFYPSELWAWKQPLVFWFWKYLPGNALSIQYAALLGLGICLGCIYFILKKYATEEEALLGVFLVSGYFKLPLTEMTIMQVEWWGLMAFIVGLLGYVYQKNRWAGIWWGVTLLVRELWLIPIGFLVLGDLVKNRKKIKEWLKMVTPLGIIFMIGYLGIHMPAISKYGNVWELTKAGARDGAETGWRLLRTTLAYNSWTYLLGRWRIFLWLLIINSLGLGYRLITKKDKIGTYVLLAVYLPFFMLALKLGIFDVWHDYWGIYYVPFLLMVTPIVFKDLGNGVRSFWKNKANRI